MSTDMHQDKIEADFQAALDNRAKIHDELLAAWGVRTRAKSRMDMAYKTHDEAYAAKKKAEGLSNQSRLRNNRLIDDHRTTRQAMQAARKNVAQESQKAYLAGDKSKAKDLSNEAKALQTSINKITSQVDSLIEENKNSRSIVKAADGMLSKAREEIKRTRKEFENARRDHLEVKDRLTDAKNEVFRASLARVSSEEAKLVMSLANIPEEYWSNSQVHKGESGQYDIYYGGENLPTGPNHGHAVVDQGGKLSYNRKPYTKHSPENFTSDQALIEFSRSRSDKEGFGLAQHIYHEGEPATVAPGWGDKQGYIAFVSGHIDKVEFHKLPNKLIVKQSDYMNV